MRKAPHRVGPTVRGREQLEALSQKLAQETKQYETREASRARQGRPANRVKV